MDIFTREKWWCGTLHRFLYPYGGGNFAAFANSCSGSVTSPPPVKPPEPPVFYAMNGDIYLQHGVLEGKELSGYKANTTARLTCTRAAKVKVRALTYVGSNSTTVNLNVDGSLQSILSVNGVVGDGGRGPTSVGKR
ncbi:hypothetical protein RSM18_004687 [Serratia marcescens]|nr:hypothetical protein [Serratia marcescens]ELI8846481.1 hypothetical protein [Serratia marcescens]